MMAPPRKRPASATDMSSQRTQSGYSTITTVDRLAMPLFFRGSSPFNRKTVQNLRHGHHAYGLRQEGILPVDVPGTPNCS